MANGIMSSTTGWIGSLGKLDHVLQGSCGYGPMEQIVDQIKGGGLTDNTNSATFDWRFAFD